VTVGFTLAELRKMVAFAKQHGDGSDKAITVEISPNSITPPIVYARSSKKTALITDIDGWGGENA
jgi:hypothetical protein